MRVSLVVSSAKHTGAAAVVELHCRALRAVGVDAGLLFVAGRNLEGRLVGEPWARPILAREQGLGDLRANLTVLREEAANADVVVSHLSHDHVLCVLAGVHRRCRLVRSVRHRRALRRDPLHRLLHRPVAGVWLANRSLEPVLPGRLGRVPRVLAPVPLEPRFGAPADGGEWRRRLGLAGPVVGVVGKLARGRGFELVLEALAELDGAALLVVGEGELRPVLERLAADLGLAGRVSWAGYRDRELPGLYAAMDVVVVAAAGSDHGHRVVGEARARARPVVAVAVPGVEDQIVHGETGWLCGSSAAELAVAVRAVLADPPAARRVAAAGAEAAREHGLEAVGAALAAHLEGL